MQRVVNKIVRNCWATTPFFFKFKICQKDLFLMTRPVFIIQYNRHLYCVNPRGDHWVKFGQCDQYERVLADLGITLQYLKCFVSVIGTSHVNKWYHWKAESFFSVSCIQEHTLECQISFPICVFIWWKMPPFTHLIWHYTIIKFKHLCQPIFSDNCGKLCRA